MYSNTARAVDLVFQTIESVKLAERIKTREGKEKPTIYWVKADDINEEILEEVIDIYESVFSKNGKRVERPSYENFEAEIKENGLIE